MSMFSKYNHIKCGGPSKHGDQLLPEVTITVMKNIAKYLNACKQATTMSIKEAHKKINALWISVENQRCHSPCRPSTSTFAQVIFHGTDLQTRVVVTPQYKRESYMLNLGAQSSPRFLLDWVLVSSALVSVLIQVQNPDGPGAWTDFLWVCLSVWVHNSISSQLKIYLWPLPEAVCWRPSLLHSN